MKKILSILFALMLVGMAGAATQINQYNQSWTLTTNSGPDIWTPAATSMYVWAVTGGNQYLVVNTTVDSGENGINLTVQSGGFWGGAAGNATVTLEKNRTYILGPFDLSRFKTTGEKIQFALNATRGKMFCIGGVKG